MTMKMIVCLKSTSLLSAALCYSLLLPTEQSATAADELLGAGAVLDQLAAASTTPEARRTNTSPQAVLRSELTTFATNSATLSPADAAKGWLALADRVFELDAKGTANRHSMGDSQSLSTLLLDALPGPAAWPALRQSVEARPAAQGDRRTFELGLRLLVHTLENDAAARKKDLAALEELSKKAPRNAAWTFKNIFRQLNVALLAASDDPDLVLKTLERELNAGEEDRWQDSLEVPNLVALVGEAKTEAFLRKALVHPKLKLEINAGTATHKLAQKLALELTDKLKVPQWSLVNSLGVTRLYEALDKQFPAKKRGAEVQLDVQTLDLPDPEERDYERQNARAYYLLSLIAEDRAKDAVAVAKNMGAEGLPDDALKALEQAGYTGALDEFLHELLSQNPEVPFWRYYANISAKAGHTDRMLALARTTLERQDLSAASKASLQQNLYVALLAADQVEAGVAELRKQISRPPARLNAYSRYSVSSRDSTALLLARLGMLTSNPEWIAEGIAAARKTIAEPQEEAPPQWSEASTATELAGLLVELGRSAEAEAILVADARQALARAAKQKNARRTSRSYDSSYPGSSSPIAPQLGALILLYHQAGRPADVVTLLDRSPDWGVGDLAELHRSGFQDLSFHARGFHGRSHGLPAQFIAAAAFAKTGRTADAKKTLTAVLDEKPGLDAAYALLLELGGTDVPAQLDALYARDRFEERPLIWKAEWLRRQGDLEAAEKICRQAISIDPSDGEQGPGDRMRAYAVLADLRAARGDMKEAEFFRGAVSAIRLSEHADQFVQAGLMKRAVAMYEESLTKFADAYCIQSRLAVQLAELGRHAEAEAHYRKAYELMPVSFGRVESHCFGCERAFDGQRAQSLAEKVFSDLAVKTPDKPQVHYLLGYLRAEQERYQEAATNYQKAVALDPDYLNAWVKLQELTGQVRLSAAQRDDLALNILRLDPASRHSGVSVGNISDLRRLWLAIAAGQKLRPVAAKSLYTLTASKAELQKNLKQPPEKAEDPGDFMPYVLRSRTDQTPAAMLRQNAFIETAGQLMSPEFSQALNAE